METQTYIFHLTSAAALVVLIALYFFGVWSRSYVFPSHNDMPVRRQLVASVPVGFLTMGLYAKTAVPALTQAGTHMVFDASVMLAYAIIFGMLSRESLERLMRTVQVPIEPATDASNPTSPPVAQQRALPPRPKRRPQ